MTDKCDSSNAQATTIKTEYLTSYEPKDETVVPAVNDSTNVASLENVKEENETMSEVQDSGITQEKEPYIADSSQEPMFPPDVA